MPDPGDELVMVGERTTAAGPPCRNHCGYNVVLDGAGAKAIAVGGSLLCLVCAVRLFRDHPDAIRRATDVEKLLGRDPK